MQNNTYRVVVIPDLDRNREIVRKTEAQNATAAAGSVLSALGGLLVDCIEVTCLQSGHRPSDKVAFYACVYGVEQGFLYADRFILAS